MSPLLSRNRVTRPPWLRRADARRRLLKGGFLPPYRFHYFGEFGYLNFLVLGGLQALFRELPRTRLEILTFPHYGELLSAFFPNNIQCRTLDYAFPEGLRQGHRSRDPDAIRRAEQLGYRSSLHKVFKAWTPHGHLVKDAFLNLRESLAWPLPSGGVRADDHFVSIFPRGRTLMAAKNLTAAEWSRVVEIVERRCSYPIVVHGVSAESVPLPPSPRFIYPKGPLEQVAYLNRSACFLSPDSGMVSFAMNCRCDALVLGGQVWFREYAAYNPFGRRLELTPRDMDRAAPQVDDFLRRILSTPRQVYSSRSA